MSGKIEFADGLSLPVDVATQTVGILAVIAFSTLIGFAVLQGLRRRQERRERERLAAASDRYFDPASNIVRLPKDPKP